MAFSSSCSLGCGVSGGLGSGGIPAELNLGRKGKHNAGDLLITLSFPSLLWQSPFQERCATSQRRLAARWPSTGDRVRAGPWWAVEGAGWPGRESRTVSPAGAAVSLTSLLLQNSSGPVASLRGGLELWLSARVEASRYGLFSFP